MNPTSSVIGKGKKALAAILGFALTTTVVAFLARTAFRVSQAEAAGPVVTFVAPSNSSTATGTITLEASSSEPGTTIANVQFQVDGVNAGSAVTSTNNLFSESLNTAAYSNTAHTLTAVATDASGTTSTASISVTFANNYTVWIYQGGGLDSGWINSSYGTATTTYNNTSIVGPGSTSSIEDQFTSGNIGFANGTDFYPDNYNSLQFYAYTTSTSFSLIVQPYNYFNGNPSGLQVTESITPNQWNFVSIPMSSLEASDTSFDAIQFYPSGPGTLYLDSIGLMGKVSDPTLATSITSPASGASVSSTVIVAATATGTLAIQNVQFQINGTTIGTATSSGNTYSISWNTSTYTSGTTTITAIATDSSGNQASTTETVTVANPDTTPPNVVITSPANNATVTSTITLAASSTDNVAVQSVQFQLDGTNLGSAVTSTNSIFSTSLNTDLYSNTTHTITAIAKDTSGNTASSSVTVTVANNITDWVYQGGALVSPWANYSNGSTTLSYDNTTTVYPSSTSSLEVDSPSGYVIIVNHTFSPSPTLYTDNYQGFQFAVYSTSTSLSLGVQLLSDFGYEPSGATYNLSVTANQWTLVNIPMYVLEPNGYNFDTINIVPSVPSTFYLDDVSFVGKTDLTPPVVTIESPASGASVSSTVTIAASSTDNAAVENVQFQVNGTNLGSAVTSTNSIYSATWDTAQIKNGTTTITAIATDSSGNQASTTETVTVANPDTTPPVVTFVTPTNGETVSSTITITASSTDNQAVRNVQFQLDGTNLGSAVTSTNDLYSVSWNSSSTTDGAHTLTAVSTDTSGNQASTTISISVHNQPDTTPPVVTFVSPAPSSTVSGIATLTVSSTDNISVANVQFQVDGTDFGSAVTSTNDIYSVPWGTLSESNGAHTLTAVSTDTSGNQASTTETVTVGNSSTTASLVGSAAECFGQSGCSVTATVASATLSFPNGGVQKTGDLLFAWSVWSSWQSVATTTDTMGNVWTPIFSSEYYSTNGTWYQAWYAVAKNSGSDSVTLQFPGVVYGAFGISEFYTPSLNSITPLDATGFNFATSTGVATLSASTTAAMTASPELIIGLGGSVSATSSTFTAGSGFSTSGSEQGGGGNISGGMEWQFASSSSGIASATMTADLPAWGMGVVTFKTYGIPPSIAITSPTTGSTASGTINITASATDNVGVKNVQFEIDGGNFGSAVTSTNSSYSVTLNTTAYAYGTHTLAAVATNNSGVQASSSVSVFFANNSDLPIYLGGSLANGWSSTSTAGNTLNYGNTATVYPGSTSSIQADYETGSLAFTDNPSCSGPLIDPQNYKDAEVAFYATSSVTVGIQTYSQCSATNPGITYYATLTPNQWNLLDVPMLDLEPYGYAFDTVSITPDATGTIFIDNMQLLGKTEFVSPTVSFTSPANGSTLNSTTTLSVNATDDTSVQYVQFQMNGENIGSQVTSANGTFSMSWNAGLYLNGTDTLTAVAVDSSGNESSSSITVTVDNPSTTNDFVTVQNGKFYLNGNPFYFGGTNAYYLAVYQGLDPAYVTQMMDSFVQNNVRVIRIDGFYNGTFCSAGGATDPVIQTAPGVYSESALEDLDAVIKDAHDLGIKVIVTLGNEWNNLGGVCQYDEWAGLSGVSSTSTPTDAQFEYFFTSTTTINMYENYISMLLNRVNVYTGLAYKDDPTIMSWDIMNEARNPAQGASTTELVSWYTQMASLIHGIDTNHLISTGEEGMDENSPSEYNPNYTNTYFMRSDTGSSFIQDMNIPYISYANIHVYPDAFGFSIPSWATDTDLYINDHAKIAASAGKPLLVGEYGYGYLNAWVPDDPQKTTFYDSVWANDEQNSSVGGDMLWELVNGAKCVESQSNICISRDPNLTNLFLAHETNMYAQSTLPAVSSGGSSGGGGATVSSNSGGAGGGGYVPVLTPNGPVYTAPAATTQTAQTSSNSGSSASVSPVTAILGYRERGTEVKDLQIFLASQGVFPNDFATGYFGPLTLQAVQKFQCNEGIVCSGGPGTTGWGHVGPATLQKIQELSQGQQTSTQPPTQTQPSTPSTPGPVSVSLPTGGTITQYLARTEQGNQVKDLQKFLASMGVFPKNLETGYFGDVTLQAVQKFQCQEHIVCSGGPGTTGWGHVGPATLQKVAELSSSSTAAGQ
ncbi:Ig-like domain-containing protein [Patescibacteria group bacterium]|nr:Ig-like domain-containing protein [Patescibacteria group bacterium]